MSNEYNGWTNYETWRVNLEIFSSMEIDEPMTREDVRTFAEDLIEASSMPGLARDYAMSFLSEVNWQEIADNLNDYNEANFSKDDEDEDYSYEEDGDPYADSEWAGGQQGEV